MNDLADSTYTAGLDLIARGWAVFLLAEDSPRGKIPPKNCERCDVRTGERHDRETCPCLLCHGFYAATLLPDRWELMVQALPHGYLAVRTGRASRLMVIDAEAHGDGDGPTGIEVIESWEEWTGGRAGSLPRTLAAHSVSGGLHLYYRIPGNDVVHGRSRVLPAVDVKAEGGYVGAVGSRAGKRRWQDPSVPVQVLPPEALRWLQERRGAHAGGRAGGRGGGGGFGSRPDGYDFARFSTDGCPLGFRDYFINDVIFRLRRAGTRRAVAETTLIDHWSRLAQPDGGESTDDWFPWEWVEYKLDRVWNEVDPGTEESRARELLRRWTRPADEVKMSDGGDTEPRVVRMGRATIVRRERRRGW